MATYLLTWNPKIDPWEDLASDIASVAAGKVVNTRWTTGKDQADRCG